VTSAVASAEPMMVSAAPMMRASTSTTTNLLGNPGLRAARPLGFNQGMLLAIRPANRRIAEHGKPTSMDTGT
jgi:hypothetical protein